MKIAIIFTFLLYSSHHYISTPQCMCLLVGIGWFLAVLTKGKEKNSIWDFLYRMGYGSYWVFWDFPEIGMEKQSGE